MSVRRIGLEDGRGADFLKDVGGKMVERFGILEMLDQTHRTTRQGGINGTPVIVKKPPGGRLLAER
jgi:hypothetical protein